MSAHEDRIIILPNGEVYKISPEDWDSDWGFLKNSEVTEKFFLHSPLPIETRIRRSHENESGGYVTIIEIPVNGTIEKTQFTTSTPLLTQSLIFLPTLEHPQGEWGVISKKTYIHLEKKNVSIRGMSEQAQTRVKWFIPKNPGNGNILVYKSTKNVLQPNNPTKEIINELREQNLTLSIYISSAENREAHKKIRELMTYEPPLLTALKKTPSQVLAIAEALCNELKAFHNAGILVNDLKAANILCSGNRVHFIDSHAWSRTAAAGPNQDRLFSPANCRPNEVHHPSSESDIYALGITLCDMHKDTPTQQGRSLPCLGALLATQHAEDALSLAQVDAWFALLKESRVFINNIVHYYPYEPYKRPYITETPEQTSRRQTIKDFLDFYKEHQTELSNFHLEAIGCLFRSFPEHCTKENWKKLLVPDTGDALTCVMVGVNYYLSGFSEWRRPTREKHLRNKYVIKDLFDNNKSLIQTVNNIVEHPDSKRRKNIFTESVTLLAAQEKTQNLSKAEQMKFSLCFPKADKTLKEAYKNLFSKKDNHDVRTDPTTEYDSLLMKRKIIVASMNYITSSRAGIIGKSAVRELITHLLTESQVLEKTAIEEKVISCCKARLFASASSIETEGSRANLLIPALN